MDVFRTDRIRNVVLLGHGGAGKTSLVEAMAYLCRYYKPFRKSRQMVTQSVIMIKRRLRENSQLQHL